MVRTRSPLLLAAVMACAGLLAPQADAQNRGYTYRPPPPPPPAPVSRPQSGGYSSSTNRSGGYGSSTGSANRPYSSGSPGVSQAFRGSASGSAAGGQALRGGSTGSSAASQAFRGGTGATAGGQSLRGGAGASAGAQALRGSAGTGTTGSSAATGSGAGKPSFGTQVKPYVGSGVAAQGGTSGLRSKFAAAAGGNPPPPGGGSGGSGGGNAGAGGSGGGGPGGGKVPPSGDLKSKFNAAARGDAKTDNTQVFGLHRGPRIQNDGSEFAKNAKMSEKIEAKKGAEIRGRQIDEAARKKREKEEHDRAMAAQAKPPVPKM